MTRLLALDLDGTVLSFDLKLDGRDVEALHRAVAAGITVVACTGRPFPGALPWVRRLGLDQPIVCYQGAQVRTPDGGTLLDQGVPHDLALEVVSFARERDLHVQAYRDDRLIVERDRPEAHEYANHAGMEINVVGDLDTAIGPTTGRSHSSNNAEMRARWAGRLEANTSMPTYLEVTNAGANKSRALQFLCERLGIPHDMTVAVGDGRNDSSMLSWAARGYAVAGADPEVISAADGRTIGGPGTGGIASLVSELLEGN